MVEKTCQLNWRWRRASRPGRRRGPASWWSEPCGCRFFCGSCGRRFSATRRWALSFRACATTGSGRWSRSRRSTPRWAGRTQTPKGRYSRAGCRTNGFYSPKNRKLKVLPFGMMTIRKEAESPELHSAARYQHRPTLIIILIIFIGYHRVTQRCLGVT